MPENQTEVQTTEKKPGNIVSAGRPERGIPSFVPQAPAAENVTAAVDNGQAAAAATAPENGQPSAEVELPTVTDEQLQQLLEKKGIKGFENFDKLKETVDKSIAPAQAEPTAEEKEAKEKAFEKRMADYFVENGGTIDDFVHLKTIASADLKLLSESEIRREMKENNFTDDEIKMVLTERYYQINPEEIVQGEDESEEDFAKRKALIEKKIAYGSKKFENRSSYMKTQAENALKNLREAIKAEDLLKQQEIEFSSKVEEHSKTLPRKITFEMGEVNSQKIDPVSFDVPEAVVAEVAGILKDEAKRKQFLFNPDNSLNLTNLMDAMIGKKILDDAVKAALLEGGSRQVTEFEKRFPNNAHDLGVGGQNKSAGQQGRKGVYVESGKPQVVARQQ